MNVFERYDLNINDVVRDKEEVLHNEKTPLIGDKIAKDVHIVPPPSDPRKALFLFLEARTPGGLVYESFTILLIFLSVVTFVLSSLFLPKYIPQSIQCGPLCDAIWFGNDDNNALEGLGLGPTSIVEIFTVGVFTIDYLLRFYTADFLDDKYKGFVGRLRFIPSFFSLVDLASTIPFYIDALFLPDRDLASSNFLRMFRLLRMMRVEGRYDLALGLIDDVIYEQKDILGTGLFIGVTTWAVLASFFYVAERKNNDMIYCGAAPEHCFYNQEEIDTSKCVIDEYGFVDCSMAGCPGMDVNEEPCWHLYRSIADASFGLLWNYLGDEFPLVDQHSVCGKILGTFTACIAVAVFALPVGILGSGFEDIISRRRQSKRELDVEEIQGNFDVISMDHSVDSNSNSRDEFRTFVSDNGTIRGILYNFLHAESSLASIYFDKFINLLVVGTSLTFMFETLPTNIITLKMRSVFDAFELVAVAIFTLEYLLRVYSVAEHPKYRGFKGRLAFATSFLAIVDLLSFLPYWINSVALSQLSLLSTQQSTPRYAIKFLRLLRLFRFEKYTNAFSTFDDIVRDNLDILSVTGFSAVLLWILFSAILYYSERNNPDSEMANYYKSVPHAMWITLLNLSGECPLAHYSLAGKITICVIGLFATAIFGVPIGILGAGFEELVTSTHEDTPDDDSNERMVGKRHTNKYCSFQEACYNFVNGIGSTVAVYFEISIYFLIAASVTVGIIQTVENQENTFHQVEWISVIVFTFEYIVRLIGAGVDPEFSSTNGRACDGIWSRLKYMISFYSIVDLLAILPFYLSVLFPESWFDQHDEYLRMFRLLRLLKLDKYFPSITLIDDVFRLKKNVLIISSFAGVTLWILFAGVMYLVESRDHSMEIDNLPLYNCDTNCTMSDRYRNYFTSMSYTGIHLTGDFPATEYDALGRIVCFFMIIAAIGIVSIPSGLIASGFVDIVQSKTRKGEQPANVGDDWFDIKYRQLEGKSPPISTFGPLIDRMQQSVNFFLNGVEDEDGKVVRSNASRIGRNFFFLLIVSNVIAVIVESLPEVDRYVGNEKGNFFDRFEEISIVFFTLEYFLRLFSAPKSRMALYSSWVYATTFFGLVDLLSIAPWYIQQILLQMNYHLSGDEAQIFRIFRIFRILQLEDFVIAFSKLDNVFRASKDVLKATGVMAIIIWCGSSALFYIFEQNNPNLRSCDPSVPLVHVIGSDIPGCYDFESTSSCNEYYPGMCSQAMFTNMPNTMYYVAVFLGGDWGFIDFTWQGRLVCLFLCIAGIAIYALPVGTLFDSFGAVVGIVDDEEEEKEEKEG